MLSYVEELRDRVRRLLADVAPLATASGLGFVAEDRRLAEAALGQLRSQGWAYCDLRETDAKQTEAALVRACEASAEVLVICAGRAILPGLEAVLRAYADKKAHILLGTRRFTRPDKGSVVVVVDGAERLDGLGLTYQRLPYWDFVP